MKRYFQCYVEWEEEDGKIVLSTIPWRVFLRRKMLDVLGLIIPGENDFYLKWVPSWKIRFVKGEEA